MRSALLARMGPGSQAGAAAPIRRRPTPFVPAIDTRPHLETCPALCDEQGCDFRGDVVRFADPPRFEVDIADMPRRPARDRDSHATSICPLDHNASRSNANVFRLAEIDFVRAEMRRSLVSRRESIHTVFNSKVRANAVGRKSPATDGRPLRLAHTTAVHTQTAALREA